MKIGYMYDMVIYPPKGGNHTHALEITRSLSDLGHIVIVVDDMSIPDVESFNSKDKGWAKKFDAEVDVICVRIDARSLRHWKAFSDLISVHTKPIFVEINAPSFESWAFSWLGGKNIWKNGGNESLFRRARRWFHAKRQLINIIPEERFRKKISPRFSGAVCISTAIEAYASSLGIGNTVVLPNGGPLFEKAYIENLKKDDKEVPFTIFYSGSAMYPWQGLDLLAAVIKIAEIEAPEIKFVLAVNQKVDDLPKTKNVSILEGISQEEVYANIVNSDICMCLFHQQWWNPLVFHGSPIKLFEYMALAGTVLASDHSQMKEVIDDGVNGYLTGNDPRDIFEKILHIRERRNKAHDVGLKAWDDVQAKYNWNEIAAKTVGFFSN